jgi:N-methylhydantoinase A
MGAIAAIDLGGTFVDVMVARDGRREGFKLPVDARDRRGALREAIARIGTVDELRHSTTITANALIERRGARVGFIATAGFIDVLDFGRQARGDLYARHPRPCVPDFLAPSTLRAEVAERLDTGGAVVTPLDESGMRREVARLKGAGAEALAIGFLFAHLNPAHERRAGAIAAESGLPVSLSSSVDPRPREYERWIATAADAYVRGALRAYLADLAAMLTPGTRFRVLQGSGALVDWREAAEAPLSLALSGQAAAMAHACVICRALSIDRAVALDIGGTSADVAIIGAEPALREDAVVGAVPIRARSIAAHGVGAGGGACLRVTRAGLTVGPDAAPKGPACFARGGEQASIADAQVALGVLQGALADGAVTLDQGAARAAIARDVATPLGLSVEEAARTAIDVADASLAEAVRAVTIKRGIDPRDLPLIALGGAGAMHAARVAELLDMTRVVVPTRPGLAAAAGLLDGVPVDTMDQPSCRGPIVLGRPDSTIVVPARWSIETGQAGASIMTRGRP